MSGAGERLLPLCSLVSLENGGTWLALRMLLIFLRGAASLKKRIKIFVSPFDLYMGNLRTIFLVHKLPSLFTISFTLKV